MYQKNLPLQSVFIRIELLDDIEEILEKMVYVQFGAVGDFLQMMVAAQAIPHTDMERFPTVKKEMEKRTDKK